MASEERMVKIMVIGGSGHWYLAHLATLQNSQMRIIAVAPGCPEEDITSLIRAVPDAKRYDDWRMMLKCERAEIAVVNPWFALNAEIADACLKNGMHVYCEKPLATTLEQLSRLEATWRASGRALGGMFNYRYCPWFLAMQTAVQQQLIGEVRLIHAQKSYKIGIRPVFYKDRNLMGGLIPWVAIHAIDWVCAFGGRGQWVSAAHSRIENHGHGDLEVSSAVLLGMENGCIATVTADYFRPDGSARHDDDRLRITGTCGMIEVIDGHVYLENGEAKRELILPEEKNAFSMFVQSIHEGWDKSFAEDSLYATYVSLCARKSADDDGERIVL